MKQFVFAFFLLPLAACGDDSPMHDLIGDKAASWCVQMCSGKVNIYYKHYGQFTSTRCNDGAYFADSDDPKLCVSHQGVAEHGPWGGTEECFCKDGSVKSYPADSDHTP